MSTFVDEQRQAFEGLRSKVVTSWRGLETAVHDAGPNGDPIWNIPAAPCLQLELLSITLQDVGGLSVLTYQNDDLFGLQTDDLHQEFKLRFASHRWRTLTELPVGLVERVDITMYDADVAEVLLRIGSRPILLMAGEIEPTWTDAINMRYMDESVLVFTAPEVADLMQWNLPRSKQTPDSLD
jgi:hypothetical protein